MQLQEQPQILRLRYAPLRKTNSMMEVRGFPRQKKGAKIRHGAFVFLQSPTVAAAPLFNLDVTESGAESAFLILPIICLILFGIRILCTRSAVQQ